jgi:hypothetical protein
MPPLSRRKLRRGVGIALIAATILVVVLLILIVEGFLVVPSSSPTPITITSVELKIDQGTTASGTTWFGPSYVNYTSAEGYPIQVAPGGTWTVVWTFINFDNHYHNITGVFPDSPFTLYSTSPKLAYELPPDSDQCSLAITISAPSTAGATYAVTVVVDAGMVS